MPGFAVMPEKTSFEFHETPTSLPRRSSVSLPLLALLGVTGCTETVVYKQPAPPPSPTTVVVQRPPPSGTAA